MTEQVLLSQITPSELTRLITEGVRDEIVKLMSLTQNKETIEIEDELYLSNTTADIDTLLHTRFEGEADGFIATPWPETVVPILYTRDLGKGLLDSSKLDKTVSAASGARKSRVSDARWPTDDKIDLRQYLAKLFAGFMHMAGKPLNHNRSA